MHDRPRKYAPIGMKSCLSASPIAAVVGRTVEPALRQQRVDAHGHCEEQREHVRRIDPKRQASRAQRAERHAREADREQDLLPGLEGGQSAPADSGAVERGHDRVVHGQTDDPRVQRHHRPPPDEDRDRHEHEPVNRQREPGSHQAGSKPGRARLRRARPLKSKSVAPGMHGAPPSPTGSAVRGLMLS